jgi:hypothetical protein
MAFSPVTRTAKHTLNTRTARKTIVTTVLAAILRMCTHIALNIMASRISAQRPHEELQNKNNINKNNSRSSKVHIKSEMLLSQVTQTSNLTQNT